MSGEPTSDARDICTGAPSGAWAATYTTTHLRAACRQPVGLAAGNAWVRGEGIAVRDRRRHGAAGDRAGRRADNGDTRCAQLARRTAVGAARRRGRRRRIVWLHPPPLRAALCPAE